MDEREPLNADDFTTDNPPNRQQCRQLLEEASGNAERILGWNRMIDRLMIKNTKWNEFDDNAWRPSLSDKDDPWEVQNLNLSIESEHAYATFYFAHVKHAQLSDARLDKCTFMGSELDGTDFYMASFRETGFAESSFKECVLGMCDFTDSEIEGVDFTKAGLFDATLLFTTLSGADFTGANFGMTNMSRCPPPPSPGMFIITHNNIDRYRLYAHFLDLKFRFLQLKYNLTLMYTRAPNRITSTHTTIDGVDMRTVKGFTPNGESAQGTRFAPNANDPYSILRRKYTGPMLLFHLILIAVFFLPYIMKAGAWTLAERAQESMIENGIATSTLAESEHFAEHAVWWVVLGFREGVTGFAMGSIAILFIFYNLVRVYVTRRMSLLRDAEERSGYLPEMKEYWACFNWHRYFLVWVYLLAMGSFLIHFVSWMFDSVYVPTAIGG